MMLRASLIRVKCSPVSVIAQETILEPLAAAGRHSDGRAANNQSLALNAWQVLQFLQLADEGLEDLLGGVVAEFEEDYRG